jgi:hypothetical protein
MDILEAIRVFSIPVDWGPDGLPSKQMQPVYADRERFNKAEQIVENPKTYYHATLQEGREIARAAFNLLDTGMKPNAYLPHKILTNLANVVPGSLQGLYLRLLERDFGWGSDALFREADAQTRDQIIALLETGTEDIYRCTHLLCALAWIGDEVVQARFAQWRRTPPAWSVSLSSPLEDYTYQAGWELTVDGRRRDLCHLENYDLVAADEAAAAIIPGPEVAMTPDTERCRWCERPLFTLFDIDLRDRRMAFLGMAGERLRIVTCPDCAYQMVAYVFTDVAGDGTAHWSEVNGDPPEGLEVDEEGLSLPSHWYVLGSKRKTPYEGTGSHIGGYPDWVQWAQYPRCPTCGQTMMFIGQLEPQADYLEGIVYAFLCVPCGKATTVYQQT